jgi:PPOX class probable F420-dependent enzyme
MDGTLKPQRRGRSIAMTSEERDEFLTEQLTCRLASVGADGAPHVTPVWFVWDGAALWVNSLVRSQRWVDVVRDGRVAVVVDGGEAYTELRGIEIRGHAEPVGQAPRTAAHDPAVAEAERLFARKYQDANEFTPDGRHGWLRMTQTELTSWDFRKLPNSQG